MEWMAELEARAEDWTSSFATPLTAEQLERFATAMAAQYGTVSGGRVTAYGATFSVEGDTHEDAFIAASKFWQETTAGLPEWPVVRFALTEAAGLDADLTKPNFPDLLGVSEIGKLLGVTRQRASVITKMPAFPTPVAQLATGPVWTGPSIDLFLENWARRPGRPLKEPHHGATSTRVASGKGSGKTSVQDRHALLKATKYRQPAETGPAPEPTSVGAPARRR